MFIVIWFIFGVVTAIIARTKGRTVVGWFFVGFLLGLIGLIIILCMPNLKEQKSKELAEQRERIRLREQLLQEKLKNEAFRRHASSRLDAHDSALQLDTKKTEPLNALEARSLSQPILQSSDNMSKLMEQTAAIPQTQSDRKWHYLIDRDQMGPITENEIIELFRMRYLNHETLVWTPGYQNWVKAVSVQTFSQVL